jgi:hypothetical protein
LYSFASDQSSWRSQPTQSRPRSRERGSRCARPPSRSDGGAASCAGIGDWGLRKSKTRRRRLCRVEKQRNCFRLTATTLPLLPVAGNHLPYHDFVPSDPSSASYAQGLALSLRPPRRCRRGQGDRERVEAGDVPARLVERRDEAAGDGIAHVHKDDRDRPRLPLEGSGHRGPGCHDDVRLQAGQLMRECRVRLASLPFHLKSIRTLRPSVQPKCASACVNAAT